MQKKRFEMLSQFAMSDTLMSVIYGGGVAYMKGRIVFVLGIAFLWPCLRNTFFLPFAAGEGFSPSLVVLFISIMACALFFGFTRNAGEFLASSVAQRVLLCVSFVGSFTLFLSGQVSSGVLSTFAAAFSGASFSLLIVLWARVGFFLRKTEKWITLDAILALFLSYLFTAFVIPAPEGIAVVYPWFLLLSAVAYTAIPDDLKDGKSQDDELPPSSLFKGKTGTLLLSMAFFVAIMSVVAGAYSSGISTLPAAGNESGKYIVSLVFAMVLCVVAFRCVNLKMRTKAIWGLTILTVFAGSLASLILGVSIGFDVVVVCRLAILVLFWSLLVEYSESVGVLGRCVGFFFLGSKGMSLILTDVVSLARVAGAIPDFVIQVVLLVAVLLLILCAFFFIDSWNAEVQVKNSGRQSVPYGDSDRLEACNRIAEKCALSERELSVMVFLSRGYTAKKIGEVLYLSENTVRTYTKALYRKTDCHSKQELIDFVSRVTEAQ